MGAELRELREKSHLTTREVARRLGWSASTVSRTETGHRNISSEDVAALLALYGVAGKERDHLLALAREANQPGWWETRHPGLPSQLTALIGFESQATRITDVALIVVPGLLQTADYARAVMKAAGISAMHAETRVATRLGRQAALSRPAPPQYLAILDEAVLRRPIGGRATMAAQLRHILSVAERPNVEVRVLAYDQGAHAGLAGSFVVLTFPKAPAIVHLEHKRSSLLLDEPGDVTAFIEAADLIRNVAFDPIRSAEFIAKVAAEYES
ncbi:helix-turn-helix domain-containing protein [Actinoallomurus rhizosphaericola]|uniref:helix-turn-helix domain-containing protein n=1 Tax=Actinoallomurus rhizosphaericola TaxID=2952536 RepID=UPI00209002F6|nr:helix-turn-helix transcriptional regulator [Actinoallomurus rhizosphaericola]MCO5994012.1 helix-turn-helix domain-containing protein [Actinoallomurus rhizosphaericola]